MWIFLAKALYHNSVMADISEGLVAGHKERIRQELLEKRIGRKAFNEWANPPLKYPPFIKDKHGKYDRIPYELMTTTKEGKGFTQETLIENKQARAFAAKYSRYFYQKGGAYCRKNDETVYFHGRRDHWYHHWYQSWVGDWVMVFLTLAATITVVFAAAYVVQLIFTLFGEVIK